MRAFCFLIFCCLLILAAGCTRNEPRADLVVVNGAEPESLDPAIITGQPDMRVVIALFEGLDRGYVIPKTAGAIPGLAEKWEVSPDGLVYTFHLRTNLVWSTGEPLTANDVIYSWLRALNPVTGSEYAGQLYYLKNGEEYNTGVIKDPSRPGGLRRRWIITAVRAEVEESDGDFSWTCARFRR